MYMKKQLPSISRQQSDVAASCLGEQTTKPKNTAYYLYKKEDLDQKVSSSMSVAGLQSQLL